MVSILTQNDKRLLIIQCNLLITSLLYISINVPSVREFSTDRKVTLYNKLKINLDFDHLVVVTFDF